MADTLHQALINAPSKNIYPLLSTKKGLQQWLRPDDGWNIKGAESTGGTLVFQLNDGQHSMKVVKLDPDKQVRWECIQGPDEWLGTTVDFFIDDRVKKCILQFGHTGWKSQDKFFQECDQAWGKYMTDIKKAAEGE